MSTCPPVLSEALEKHSTDRREAFMQHLLGGTSANYLADWLKRAGTPVGSTTIKDARRRLTA